MGSNVTKKCLYKNIFVRVYRTLSHELFNVFGKYFKGRVKIKTIDESRTDSENNLGPRQTVSSTILLACQRKRCD